MWCTPTTVLSIRYSSIRKAGAPCSRACCNYSCTGAVSWRRYLPAARGPYDPAAGGVFLVKSAIGYYCGRGAGHNVVPRSGGAGRADFFTGQFYGVAQSLAGAEQIERNKPLADAIAVAGLAIFL